MSAPSASLTVIDLAARCGPIELLLVDVDGVLTDGVIALDDNGVETKHFHVRDGSAIVLWRKAGKRVAILSGRRTAVVDRRAAELGISPVIQARPTRPSRSARLLADLGLDAPPGLLCRRRSSRPAGALGGRSRRVPSRRRRRSPPRRPRRRRRSRRSWRGARGHRSHLETSRPMGSAHRTLSRFRVIAIKDVTLVNFTMILPL